METRPTAAEQQQLVSSFLEIAVGQTAATATQFLQVRPVDAFRNFDEGSKRSAVWESDESAPSTSNGSHDNLASLYSPPFALMYQGPFEQVREM
ncbi:hypothetical protein BHE74_00054400 [Ensete ventricosum]|nr:hypothetical protein GW17_00022314 [Ensete ventricosum]RWW40213.1 hypothetical protein BHE74_00054400 [Ensete ventricosum]